MDKEMQIAMNHAIRSYADGDPELIYEMDQEIQAYLAGELALADLSDGARDVVEDVELRFIK